MEFVRVYYVDVVAPGFRAMTIPPFGIYIRKEFEGDQVLLNHELIHWEQYLELGLLSFYSEYACGCFRYGYHNCPMEVEARYLSEQSNYAE